MDELIEKTEQLKKSLDKTKEIQELQAVNKEIMKDKELLKDIEEYNRTQDEKIKKRIINKKIFREYKKKETDCNILIMSINQKLKTINSERSCNK